MEQWCGALPNFLILIFIFCYSDDINQSDEDAESEEDSPRNSSSKKKKRAGRQTNWPEAILTDFIDIIVTSEYYKKKLIFQNTKIRKMLKFTPKC